MKRYKYDAVFFRVLLKKIIVAEELLISSATIAIFCSKTSILSHDAENIGDFLATMRLSIIAPRINNLESSQWQLRPEFSQWQRCPESPYGTFAIFADDVEAVA